MRALAAAPLAEDATCTVDGAEHEDWFVGARDPKELALHDRTG